MSDTSNWTPTVPDLLKNWGLQQYIENFEREDVDIEALMALEPTNNSLTESLIPLGGKRAIFLKKLKEFQLSGFEKQVIVCENVDTILTNFVEVDENYCLQETDKENVAEEERPAKRLCLDLQQKQDHVLLDLQQLDLSAYLSDSNTGRLIILKYRDKVLDDQVRKKLVEIIIWKLMESPVAVRYLDENQTQKVPTLKNHHFEILSSKITDLFPKESKETYYIPPKAEGSDRKIARGKLVDKYRNWLSSLSNLGLLTRKSKKNGEEIEEEAKNVINECLENADVQWLKHNKEPWEDVLKHWRKCSEVRLRDFESSNGSVHKIYEQWPVLRQSQGYVLIASDFEQKYGRESSFYKEWPSFSRNIYQIMKSQIKDAYSLEILELLDLDDISEDQKNIQLLMLLPALCPPVCRIRKPKSKEEWKPTIAESLNSFILHVQIPGDIQNKLKELRNKHAQWALSLQPIVVVVGPNLSTIRTIYVVVDEFKYEVESILKAVDICFKCFHVFNAEYPKQCEQVSLLIQKSIYDLTTRWDRKIPNVINTIARLKDIAK